MLKAALLAVLFSLAPIATHTGYAQYQPTPPGSMPPESNAPIFHPTERGTYLGITTGHISGALRAQLQIPRGMGITILSVRPGSPAARAGLAANDVLTRFDNQFLVNPSQFVVLVRNKRPGNQIALKAFRQGKPIEFEVTLGEAMMISIEEEAALAARVGGPNVIVQGGEPYNSTVNGEMANASEITFKDDLYDITVKLDASAQPLKKSVTVRDVRSGQVIFQGNINTPEERAAVRSEIVERLKQMKTW